MSRHSYQLACLLITSLLLGACGHVSGNFPDQPQNQNKWLKEEFCVESSYGSFSVRVCDRMPVERIIERRTEMLNKMSRGSGKGKIDAMEAKSREDSPYFFRLLDDSEDFFFYRGDIRVYNESAPLVGRGDFVVTFLVGEDTIEVPDDGIVFINHSDSNNSLYTEDAAIQLSPKFNGLPRGAYNRLLLRSKTKGKVIAIEFTPPPASP